MSGSLHCIGIRGEVIGVDHFHILADVLLDELCNRSRLDILGVEQTKFAVALTNPNYDFFVVCRVHRAASLVFAADVGFVHFEFAVEHRLVHLNHRRADSVAEIPCRLIASESKRALNLARRNTFLRFADQQRSHEPLGSGKMGIVEDRADCGGELVVAILAVVESLFGFQFYDFHLATWAPTPSGQRKRVSISRHFASVANMVFISTRFIGSLAWKRVGKRC